MDNKYQIWLKQWNTMLRLPLLPEDISFNLDQQNENITLDKLGDTTIIQTSAPITFQISSHFPAAYFPQCNYAKFEEPMYFVSRIRNMKKSGTIRVVITDTPINLETTIETCEFSEKAGDVGSIYYTLGFKEYKQPIQNKVEIKSGKIIIPNYAGTGRVDARIKPKTYTVKEGDFLMKIATEVLGKSSSWVELLNLNSQLLKNNPNNLKAGMVLKIPDNLKDISGRA